MVIRPSIILAPLLIVAGLAAVSAAETGAPAPVTRIGATEKICQLTGDIDWETGRPTAARTFANFGLDAADLGYPVEHLGKLVLLFGDSWPPPHPPGSPAEAPPDDAVGIVLRREPPGNDGNCLGMRVNTRFRFRKRFAPAVITGPVPIKQGFFNVPSGGVSAAGGLYAFFWTNHCAAPNPLLPSPGDPFVRPQPSQRCPESNDHNSIGKGIMARSGDDGRTFNRALPMPVGFVYSTAVNTNLQASLPEDQRLGILIFGVPRYRASVPYLAYAPIAAIADPARWRFFIGREANGQPKWASHAEWMRGAGWQGAAAPQSWRPPGEPEIVVPLSPAGHCIGEFSVTWNPPLGLWLMLHNCPRGISARVAPAPWGPWSAPSQILGGDDDLACRLVMIPRGCGNRRNFWPRKHKDGKFTAGGLYAPFVLNRYTAPAAGGNGPVRRSTVYWVVSTWNPYEVTVMRTTLQSDAR